MLRWSNLALVAAWGVAACGAPVDRPTPGPAADQRLAIIVAALDGALEKRKDSPNVFVDDRLQGHTSLTRPPTEGDRVGVPSDLNAAFQAVLRTRGVSTMSAFEWRPGCSGILVAASEKVLDDCPEESTEILVFGLPAPGAQGLWEVPMFSSGFTPRGSTGTVYKVEVREVDGRPEYVREVEVLFID